MDEPTPDAFEYRLRGYGTLAMCMNLPAPLRPAMVQVAEHWFACAEEAERACGEAPKPRYENRHSGRPKRAP